jgi:rRNA maturation RNase YbeY
LARLVIHGVLHLAGLDHQSETERRHMRELEDSALSAVGHGVLALDRALRP